MVTHFGIVTDMCTLKQEVIVANDGLAVTLRTTIDDHVLTDDVVVTNDNIRFLTTEIEVLRQGSNDTALMDLITFTNT